MRVENIQTHQTFRNVRFAVLTGRSALFSIRVKEISLGGAATCATEYLPYFQTITAFLPVQATGIKSKGL